jgi:hypothetical protein
MALDLMLDTLHLVFEAQLKFLEPNFFKFFVVGEVPLLGEGFQSLGVLRVLLHQSLELIMTGEEGLSWSQHPARPPIVLLTAQTKSSTGRVKASIGFRLYIFAAGRKVALRDFAP